MAQLKERRKENISGNFYVDRTCKLIAEYQHRKELESNTTGLSNGSMTSSLKRNGNGLTTPLF
ncbi:MAG: hypothetical protein QNJ54_04500 [Prochloraceae cyanobacterium]|nr:hypothetical protein [Prochloraceae cyanobacterium]